MNERQKSKVMMLSWLRISQLAIWSVIITSGLVFTMGMTAGTNSLSTTDRLELIHNGDFEGGNHLKGWSLFAVDDSKAEIALDSSIPLNEQGPHSLRIGVKDSLKRCGVAYEGSMNFKGHGWYDFTFHARTETNKHFGLVVSMESQDGKTVCARATIPEVGGDWVRYTLALNARQTVADGRLVITMCEPGTIWLDSVSLAPRKTSE